MPSKWNTGHGTRGTGQWARGQFMTPLRYRLVANYEPKNKVRGKERLIFSFALYLKCF
ncbi:MAG: hypothetical protein NZ805_12235 [Armatimonadetes bacterium]|nr:hypothetical protein [Armatimonadota bacterium]MDW8028122.1 hypothetical protein [Armatimonadota bacterium]